MDIKNKFEVPYNFDESLIKYYIKHKQKIKFLYLPPFAEDLINTRSSIQTSRRGYCYMPKTRDEYESHLRLIKSVGLPFVVLWQSLDNIISKRDLDYYSNLGANGFIIANDFNAKIIKDYNPSLYVICSLVQRLRSNIINKDFQYYDFIILYYSFNRALDAIKKLAHLKEKIVILPNSLCHIDCPSIHHWFPKNEKALANLDCWLKEETLDKCGMIFPEHIYLFDQHIGGFKLQGREYSTEAIKHICHFYFEGIHFREFVFPFLNNKMGTKLYNLAHETPVEEYYNTNTLSIISHL